MTWGEWLERWDTFREERGGTPKVRVMPRLVDESPRYLADPAVWHLASQSFGPFVSPAYARWVCRELNSDRRLPLFVWVVVSAARHDPSDAPLPPAAPTKRKKSTTP